MPPSPEVMKELHAAYQATGLTKKITFAEYLLIIGYSDPSEGRDGMDDSALAREDLSGTGPQLFHVPTMKVTGTLRVIVLLVDFDDRVGIRPREDYEMLLFSRDTYPTGSMADFYNEAASDKVNIVGTVHGWLRLPRAYSSYVNDHSGLGTDDDPMYPNNAQAMAEDAVKVAIQQGVPFPQDLDALNQSLVTALFLVHAGPGAEVLPKSVAHRHMWSHKWTLENPVNVGPGLEASVYLTVPEDCQVGVCAHELGHLAFQWDDFYDANYAKDGQFWDGTGMWDLMASGSYNGAGMRPAHPAGLHKMQHGWVPTLDLGPSASAHEVTLPPPSSPNAQVVRVRSSTFHSSQYLLLENRGQQGFDSGLPGSGLLVWRVDERLINTTPRAGLALVQADGQNQLGNAHDQNQGDAGDPFPGAMNVSSLSDTGADSTSFPGQLKSKIRLRNIARAADGTVSLEIVVK